MKVRRPSGALIRFKSSHLVSVRVLTTSKWLQIVRFKYLDNDTHSMTFNNDSSMVKFIPQGLSIDKVIVQDTKELEEIGSSFEAIADRMDYIIYRIDNEYRPERMRKRADIFRKHGYNTDDIYKVPGSEDDLSTPLGKIMKDMDKLFKIQGLVPGETKIKVVDTIDTRGFQICPYDECHKGLSSSDYIIKNIQTKRKLYINQTTSHLARQHHLLEKGNKYGISAKEFYQHFMPDKKK